MADNKGIFQRLLAMLGAERNIESRLAALDARVMNDSRLIVQYEKQITNESHEELVLTRDILSIIGRQLHQLQNLEHARSIGAAATPQINKTAEQIKTDKNAVLQKLGSLNAILRKEIESVRMELGFIQRDEQLEAVESQAESKEFRVEQQELGSEKQTRSGALAGITSKEEGLTRQGAAIARTEIQLSETEKRLLLNQEAVLAELIKIAEAIQLYETKNDFLSADRAAYNLLRVLQQNDKIIKEKKNIEHKLLTAQKKATKLQRIKLNITSSGIHIVEHLENGQMKTHFGLGIFRQSKIRV